MINRNTWVILAVAVAAGLVALRLGIPSPHEAPSQPAKVEQETASRSATESARPARVPARRPIVADPAVEARSDAAPIAQPADEKAPTKSRKPAAQHFADMQLPDKGKTPAQEIARIALSFVGVDADAEDVWVSAINDPTMPAEDRKNLIEDLNEDGFGDPDHPTADELPLIVNRLDLIESLAPDAIDGVNLAAFAEAHKDLLAMYRRLTQ